jgi:hypothetical protein
MWTYRCRGSQPAHAPASPAAIVARIASGEFFWRTARAGNRHFLPLSALRAHAKAPYKIDLLWEALMPLGRPWAARTVRELVRDFEEERVWT